MMSGTTPISIQLYTLRALGPLERVLDAVAAAGYRHAELLGSHLDDAAGTRAALHSRGLTPSGGHVGLAALRERPDRLIDACKVLAMDHVFLAAVPPEQRDMPADGWRALGRELSGLAERFARHNVKLGYHNHHWELAPKDGRKTALELMFEAAGASPLAWEADVAWLARGGADPKSWLTRYRDRLVAAHVKDIAPAGENLDQDGWADVGAGVLDWRDLWVACRAAGATWMVVEHDKPADPARTARACYTYLSRIAA
jgi:sugar phosphate isomerase/epimerase